MDSLSDDSFSERAESKNLIRIVHASGTHPGTRILLLNLPNDSMSEDDSASILIENEAFPYLDRALPQLKTSREQLLGLIHSSELRLCPNSLAPMSVYKKPVNVPFIRPKFSHKKDSDHAV